MYPKSVLEKNEENVNKPNFWKSLSAGETWKSKCMRIIPEEFVKSLPEALEHRVVFSVCWGNSWQLWLEREKDGLFMEEEDWNEFVDDNHLCPSDKLCFTHDDTMFLDARIFKNGKEVLDVPLEAEPEAELLNPQPLNAYKETTTASASASASTSRKSNGQAINGSSAVKNPEQYLLSPYSPYFVRTLTAKNDVLYVSQTFVTAYSLKFGPVDSPITYFCPSGEEKAAYKIYNGNCHVINGWARVCRRNNLKQGDSVVCEFEESGGLVSAVRVHLITE